MARTLGEMAPAWLAENGDAVDVCLSSRSRIMRNLRGSRFPHASSPSELKRVCEICTKAMASSLPVTVLQGIGTGDREDLVALRLISPDFACDQLSRAVGLNEDRSLSIMVNEEDHIRVQSILPGWSIDSSAMRSEEALLALDALDFAWSARFGFLSASPYNCGDGVRHSAMFHLVALASSKRLAKVLRALSAMNVVSRGLFGESSRAIGAYVQVSVGRNDLPALRAAAEVVMAEERAERQAIGGDQLELRARAAVDFAIGSRAITLADSVRVIAWVRWASSQGIRGFPQSPRLMDLMLSKLELSSSSEQPEEARRRADRLRKGLESCVSFRR